MERINKWISVVADHLSIWVLIVGSSAFAFAWGWAAKGASSLSEYGPIVWVAAGTFGACLFIILALGYAKARSMLARTAIERRFFSRPDAVNPLETEFRKQRIHLLDLVSPIEPIIRGKTFIDCELIGPVNIFLSGRYNISYNDMTEICGVLVKEGAPALNCIVLQDCTIMKSKMHRITLYVPETAYQWAGAALPGLFWLTPAPTSPLANDPPGSPTA
jgi:hypothetical protein